MPPLLDDIKDKIPEVNPAPAVEGLSKNQSGALYIVSLCIAIPLLAIIVWLAISNVHDTKADKDKAAQACAAQVAALQHYNDSMRTENQQLHDSLTQYKIFQQFNITPGKKQIIIIPKTEAQ